MFLPNLLRDTEASSAFNPIRLLIKLAIGIICGCLIYASWVMAQEPIGFIVAPEVNPMAAELGKVLFHDTRLSGDGKRSCSTCHDTTKNGASNARFDVSPGQSPLKFNTPTVFNAALNFRLNWEGNFSSLQDHALSLIGNPNVMGGDISKILQTLGTDRHINELAENAYGDTLNEKSLVNALAAYQSSLILVDSPFDRWLAGNSNALTDEQKRGYLRFKEIGCATCHQGKNVGGNLYQKHGIFHVLTTSEPVIVRVPSLRTAYYTPPYFHDGSAATLQQAIRAMGFAQLNVILVDEDVKSIEEFLKSLAGTYDGRWLRKPGQ
jgi:cytochrome c peroxidase